MSELKQRAAENAAAALQELTKADRAKEEFINLRCPLCTKKMRLAAKYNGRVIKCPACKDPFTVQLPNKVTKRTSIHSGRFDVTPAMSSSLSAAEENEMKEKHQADAKQTLEQAVSLPDIPSTITTPAVLKTVTINPSSSSSSLATSLSPSKKSPSKPFVSRLRMTKRKFTDGKDDPHGLNESRYTVSGLSHSLHEEDALLAPRQKLTNSVSAKLTKKYKSPYSQHSLRTVDFAVLTAKTIKSAPVISYYKRPPVVLKDLNIEKVAPHIRSVSGFWSQSGRIRYPGGKKRNTDELRPSEKLKEEDEWREICEWKEQQRLKKLREKRRARIKAGLGPPPAKLNLRSWVELPLGYSDDPVTRKAQHELIDIRKEMRAKRVQFILDERKRRKDLAMLRSTARKANALIANAAKQKHNGEAMLKKLAVELNGRVKTYALYKSGKRFVSDQKGAESVVDGYGSPELEALLQNVNQFLVNTQSKESIKMERMKEIAMLVQEWKLMDERGVDFDTIAEFKNEVYETRRYILFMENRHNSTVAKIVRSIYDYMDMNKKASAIVGIIQRHKQKRSTTRKQFKAQIEEVNGLIAEYRKKEKNNAFDEDEAIDSEDDAPEDDAASARRIQAAKQEETKTTEAIHNAVLADNLSAQDLQDIQQVKEAASASSTRRSTREEQEKQEENVPSRVVMVNGKLEFL